jgi:hypothetical protein
MRFGAIIIVSTCGLVRLTGSWCFSGKLYQCRILEAVQGGPSDQAFASRLYNTYSAVDVRSKFQSSSLRLSSHRHAVFHLRYYRNAGN